MLAVAVKELDMGVPREELISGLERLMTSLGVEGAPERDGEVARFTGPGGLVVEVGPMPQERINYPVLFPRTLVVLRGEEQALGEFYPRFLQAFLRPTG